MFSESWWREIEYIIYEIQRLEREIGYDVREIDDYEAYEIVCRTLRARKKA